MRPDASPPAPSGPRTLAIFFDGTSNDSGSGTNTADLFRLVKRHADTGTFYVEGVGAKGKPIGMAMAWGIGERVRLAYAYLAEHYRPGDRIYIFGFSRGAYSARILASMLYHAGLPGLPVLRMGGEQLAELVFDAFKCGTWELDSVCAKWKSRDRIEKVASALKSHGLPVMPAVRVRFMGLWDTVEALGWPDYEENVDVPNPRYGDQLCNIDSAAHAISLDDNRARIFTPILLTRRHLLSDCGRDEVRHPTDEEISTRIAAIVDEVYFAGAHADVGGGYDDGVGKLSGVSLNWMIEKAQSASLSLGPQHSAAPLQAQDHLAPSHDPEGAWPFTLLYKRLYRSIDRYADDKRSVTPLVKFHACLADRIGQLPRRSSEYGGPDPIAREVLRLAGSRGRFESCFPFVAGERRFTPGPNCEDLQVVANCTTDSGSKAAP